MKHRKTSFLFFYLAILLHLSAFLLISGGCATLSEPATVSEKGWTPEKLIKRSIEAYGGSEIVLDFVDMAYHCDIEVRQGDQWLRGKTCLYIKQPDRLLSTLGLEDGSKKIVYANGSDKAEWINGEPTGRDVETDLKRRRRSTMIHAFFMNKEGSTPKIIHSAEAEELSCLVLIKKADQETWQLWIDLEKFFIRKIRLLLPPDDQASGISGPLSIEWQYSDFSPIKGRMIPHSFQILLNDEVFQKGKITRFRLNQGLKDKDFSPSSSSEKG